MSFPSKLSRRAVLQALTVGAGSLSFGASPRGLGMSSSKAATSSIPKRLVIFPIANGVNDYSDFGSATSPTSFTLGPFLKPLETLGLKGDLVCIDNLEMKRPTSSVDTHFCGLTQCLTGLYPPGWGSQHSAHISLDQYVAPQLSAGLPFGELYMGTMCDSVSYSYLSSGASVPANSNPLDVYSRVFGNLTNGGPDAALRARLGRRRSVLDSVSSDLTSFIKRLPAEDQARAAIQVDSVKAMEAQIDAQLAGTGSCTKPTIDPNVNYASDLYVPQTLRAMVDLTVGALACDQTRVVMMHSYAREYHPPQFHCPWPPVNVPSWSFHELSHDLDGSPNFGAFKTAKSFHFQIAGELANKLKAIPELGGTMLDHTIILIPTEIGRGHTAAGLQWCTLGGAGLGVKTGRYLQMGTDRSYNGSAPSHTRLLVSILNALGIADTTFGDTASTGSGPLPGYLA